MVDVDAGDDGAVGLDQVDGVEAATMPTSRMTASSRALASASRMASVVNRRSVRLTSAAGLPRPRNPGAAQASSSGSLLMRRRSLKCTRCGEVNRPVR